jgi:UPF0755 protein
MRGFIAFLSAIFFLCIVALLGYSYASYIYYGKSKFYEEKVVLIPQDSGLKKISNILENEGILSDRFFFEAGAYITGNYKKLKAGEYKIPAEASMSDIVELLVSGKVLIRQITIPEGLTNLQTFEIINKEKFLKEKITKKFKEGTLMPDTYNFHRDDNREDILTRMSKQQYEFLNKNWAKRQTDLPLKNPQEALILASIVEKETGVPSERRRVAAVFINRLRLDMPLQSDPTVIYPLSNGYGKIDRLLLRKDLKLDSLYNTYMYKGLPPTPIANPGREAILAVLNPLNTKELYFVADGSGGHAFSETLQGHNNNVNNWRDLQNKVTEEDVTEEESIDEKNNDDIDFDSLFETKKLEENDSTKKSKNIKKNIIND